MRNRKGFTLVELIAVVVIISILVLLAIVSVTKYVEESRKKTFVEDAKTILSAAKTNYASGEFETIPGVHDNISRASYSKEAINGILGKKLGKSPYNYDYKYIGVIITKSKDEDEKLNYDYYVCLIDEAGNGFDYTNTKDLSVKNFSNNLSGKNCSDLYNVNVVVNNGTVDKSNQTTSGGGEVVFNVKPNQEGLEGKLSCTNGQNGVLSGEELTVSNVTSDTKCTVDYAIPIQAPGAPSDKIYSGGEQYGVTCPVGTRTSGVQRATNVGNYIQTCTILDPNKYKWDDGTTAPKDIPWRIVKRKITIKAKNQTIPYSSELNQDPSQVSTTGLAYQQYVTSIRLTPSDTNVTEDGRVIASNAVIKDNKGNAVTDNYDITYTDGKLRITKIDAVCPTMSSYNGEYDGNSHSINVENDARGEAVQYKTSGNWSSTKPTRTDVGTTTVYVQVLGNQNYNTKNCGSKTITINVKSLTVPNSPADKVYNGQEQASTINCPTGSSTSGTTKATKVGNYKQTCTLLSTKNYKWNDNTTTPKDISWKITKKTITVKAKNQEKTYDGTALNADSTCEVTVGNLVSGHKVTCVNTGSQTDPGTGTKTLSSVTIKDSANNDVTENYNITKTNGTLKVNPRIYTVNVTVKNGTVDSSSKQAEHGTDLVFNLTCNEGTNSPVIKSITNSQNASIEGSKLNVNNITNNSYISVECPLKTYTISYVKGADSSATGLPSNQTKSYGQTIILSSAEPTSTTNAFLGWSPVANATISSTWYDGGTNYNDNANLTLNAQWYDIDSLEKAYTSYVQSDDFRSESDTKSFSPSDYGNADYTPPTVEGYSRWIHGGWNMSNGLRAWKNTARSIGYLNMDSTSPKSAINYWLYFKNRVSESYSSDNVDKRIDRLQKIQDVALTYDEVIEKGYNNNMNIAAKANQTFYNAPDTGWKRLAALGYFITKVTVDAPDSVYKCSATSLYNGNIKIQNNSTTNSVSAVVQSRWLDVKEKTARTTTFLPNSKSTKGASRLEALQTLNSDKINYFPGSDLKTICVTGSNISVGSWPSVVEFKRYLDIPNGKLLGTYEYSSSSAYTNTYQNYLNATNISNGTERHKQLRMYITGGNKNWTTEDGNADTISVQSCACYISSGSATITE